MTFEPQRETDFWEYEKSLRLLEEAFNEAGHRIKFHGFIRHATGEKMIKVIGGKADQKIISIEADSAAMAVKDVAKGVLI